MPNKDNLKYESTKDLMSELYLRCDHNATEDDAREVNRLQSAIEEANRFLSLKTLRYRRA